MLNCKKKVESTISAGIFSVALFASLSLFGCGGGGGGTEVPPLMPGFTASPSSGSETISPTVSATSPANAATGIALNSSVSVTFSEAMTNSTLNTASFTLVKTTGGAALPGTVIAGSNSAMFVPAVSFAANTQYTATITTAVKDAAGNALLTNFTWRFTTGTATDTT